MIRKLSKLLNEKKCYDYLNLTLPVLFEQKNNLFLHNEKRLEFYEPSKITFEGKFCCGGTSYLLHYYLKKNYVNTKLMTSTFGYGDYFEDHCFLLYDDNIIIDPTFRQFFTKNYIGHGNDIYYNYLFENLPFIFVGTVNDFYKINYNLSLLYNEKFNDKLDVNLILWEKYIDFSHRLDFDLVVNDRKYATKKGRMFSELNEILKNKNELY